MSLANLKERRKLLGISQTSLAINLGVSLVTVQLWERGASTPSPENKQKLDEVMAQLEKEQEDKIQARRELRVNGGE